MPELHQDSHSKSLMSSSQIVCIQSDPGHALAEGQDASTWVNDNMYVPPPKPARPGTAPDSDALRPEGVSGGVAGGVAVWEEFTVGNADGVRTQGSVVDTGVVVALVCSEAGPHGWSLAFMAFVAFATLVAFVALEMPVLSMANMYPPRTPVVLVP